MAVQVSHALSSVGPLIDDEPVTAGREAQLLGDVARGEQHLAEEGSILGRGVVHSREMTLGDHQHVRGRNWPYVPERDHLLVLEYDLGGRRSGCDVAEEACHGGARAYRSAVPGARVTGVC